MKILKWITLTDKNVSLRLKDDPSSTDYIVTNWITNVVNIFQTAIALPTQYVTNNLGQTKPKSKNLLSNMIDWFTSENKSKESKLINSKAKTKPTQKFKSSKEQNTQELPFEKFENPLIWNLEQMLEEEKNLTVENGFFE